MNACSICHKHFSMPATLKRHRDALHAQQRTKFQCWSCEKINVRKENVLRHTSKTHRDTDGKFIITTLTNKHYKPEIFKPKTWVPPKPDPETSSDSTSLYLRRHLLFVLFVALRPKSTAMVIAGRSVHLTTLFPGQA